MGQQSRVSMYFATTIAALILVPVLQSVSTVKAAAQAAATPSTAATVSNTLKTDAPVPALRVSSTYGKLPISFEVNRGQTDGKVQFLARGTGFTLFLTPGEAVLSLHAAPPKVVKPGRPGLQLAGPSPVSTDSATALRPSTVRLQLIGANTKAEATGVDPLPGKSNYFIGNDPARWHTNVPTYAKVRYSNVYPGIDVAYYGNQDGRLEHDFVVASGADPNQISLGVDENSKPLIEQDGNLRLRMDSGDIHLNPPVAYQTVNGRKRNIFSGYAIGADQLISFRLGAYDMRYPLVIDPVLVYMAVFGGSSDDSANAGLAVDTSGNVYVAGCTSSPDFPLANPFQSDFPSSVSTFVSKINASGTALLYSTFLGGSDCAAPGIGVDAYGRAYVSGSTADGNFPVKNAYQPKIGGGDDAYVAVLSPQGNALEWSTYFGGSEDDEVTSAAIDASGNVYIAGTNASGSIPVLHSYLPEGAGSWIVKFDRNGALQYSSIVTGEGNAALIFAIATDEMGAVYMTGAAALPVIAVSPGAFRSSCTNFNLNCAWVAKLSPSGESFDYATYLINGPSDGWAIAVDSGHNAYVGGECGRGLPVWSSGFQKTFGGGYFDGFVVKLNATGSNLTWSTYLGANGNDSVYGLALDRHRTVYAFGRTCSSNFPVKAPIQGWDSTASPGECQFFLTTLSGSLSSIPYYSTYLGAATPDYAIEWNSGVAVDDLLNVYVGGNSLAGTIHPTPGAFSVGSSNSGQKVFVSKLSIVDDLSLGLIASPATVTHGSNLTYTMAVTSKGPDSAVNVRVSDTLPSGTTFVSYYAGGGTCTSPPVGSTGTLNCRLPQLNKDAVWDVKLTVQVNAAPGSKLSNTAATISNMQDFTPGNNSRTITTTVN